jgi:hypothetical protein
MWDVAVSMSRMRCKSKDGCSWTSRRVGELREQLGIPEFDPKTATQHVATVSQAAHRLGVSPTSITRLIQEDILPATQIMPGAPWQIPIAALDWKAVRSALRRVVERRPMTQAQLREAMTLRLPGV